MRSGWRQFARFSVVGVVSNGIFYALYLVLTGHGLLPKVAMTLTFALAVVFSFGLNRRWTFLQRGRTGTRFARYLTVYVAGYCVNVAMLMVFVDILGIAHEAVQGAAVITVASLVFVLQKYWVFKCHPQGAYVAPFGAGGHRE